MANCSFKPACVIVFIIEVLDKLHPLPENKLFKFPVQSLFNGENKEFEWLTNDGLHKRYLDVRKIKKTNTNQN